MAAHRFEGEHNLTGAEAKRDLVERLTRGPST